MIHAHNVRLAGVLMLLALVGLGCSSDGDGGVGVILVETPPGLLNREALRETFDTVWESVHTSYPYIATAPVNWESTREPFRARIDSVASRDEFRALLQEMLSELQDENTGLRDSTGAMYSDYISARQKNFRFPAWEQTVDEKGFVEEGSWGYAVIDTIGYLTFHSWDPSTFNVATFDAALEALRDTRGIILDLRIAGRPVEPLTRTTLDSTGTRMLSEDVLSRFLTEASTVALAIDPAGGGTIDIHVEPRGDWAFTQPVLALVGEGTINEGEIFAAALATLENVTLGGDTTAGLAGATEAFTLNEEWDYVLPTLGYARSDGTPIQRNPLLPDVLIPWDNTSFEDNRDGVLNSALQWMEQQLTNSE